MITWLILITLIFIIVEGCIFIVLFMRRQYSTATKRASEAFALSIIYTSLAVMLMIVQGGSPLAVFHWVVGLGSVIAWSVSRRRAIRLNSITPKG